MFEPTGYGRPLIVPSGQRPRLAPEHQPAEPVLHPVAGHDQSSACPGIERRAAADLQEPDKPQQRCRVARPARAHLSDQVTVVVAVPSFTTRSPRSVADGFTGLGGAPGISIRSSALGVNGAAGDSVMRTAFVAGLIATLSNVPASSVRYRPSGAM